VQVSTVDRLAGRIQAEELVARFFEQHTVAAVMTPIATTSADAMCVQNGLVSSG
jgi:hypothetical protein